MKIELPVFKKQGEINVINALPNIKDIKEPIFRKTKHHLEDITDLKDREINSIHVSDL